MNRIYRLVWNGFWSSLASGNEISRSRDDRGGRGSTRTAGFTVALAVVPAFLALSSPSRAQETTLLNLQNTSSQGYTFYDYTFTASLTDTFLTFQFRQDPAYWHLDDVSVTAGGSSTNLITNGGFEGASTANSFGQQVPASWTLIGQAGLQAGGTVSGSCAHSGSDCWRDGSVGGVDGLYQSFATTSGTQYTISFWLANTGGPTNEAVVQVGASEDNGGTLVPVPPTPTATDIVSAGSPYLEAGLGTTLNPAFDGGTLRLDSSGLANSQDFTIGNANGTIDSAGLTRTLSGVLSGTGGLTFSNSGNGGSVTLTNVNTYQGATTIDGGATLALSGTGSIAASSGVADNGTFDISGTTAGAFIQSLSGTGAVTLGAQRLTLTDAAATFSGIMSGTGGLTISGGAETLTGANTYSGSTLISNGATLALSGTGSIAASSGVTDNGTFDISGTTAGASIQTLSGGGTVALGAQSLTLANAADTFSGAIGGTGGVAVTGGAETLTGANTYSGSTLISSGATLALSGTGSIATSSGVTDNGTFDISGTTAGASIQTLSGGGAVALGAQSLTLANAAGIFSGSIDGTGGLAIAGGAETLSGASTYTGGTSVSGNAALTVAANAALGAAVGGLALNNGTLATTATFSMSRDVSLAGNGTFDVASATNLTDSMGTVSGSGTLVKSGDGTLTLCGPISNTGGTSVTAGTLSICGSDTGTGATSIAAGATLALTGSGSIANSSGISDNGALDISGATAGASLRSLSGSGSVALGTQRLTLTAAAGSFAGVVGGTGALAVTGGTETLSGMNTYSGGTTIGSGATLALTNGGSIAASSGVVDNGTFSISGTTAGASIQSLTGSGAVALGAQGLTLTAAAGSFAGAVGGTGSLVVTGGAQTLSGTNTYSGGTTIGSGATLALTGSGSIAASSSVADNGTFDISGTTAGASIQSLSGSGSVALGTQRLTLTAAAGSFAGAVGGAGGLAVTGGTETLSGMNTYSGGTTIGSGATLALTGGGSIANSGGVIDSGALDISATTAGASIQSLSGGGTVALGARNLVLTNAADTFSGSIGGTGGLAVTGGAETLGGANTYSGGTSLSGNATLLVAADAALGNVSGAVTLNGGTLETTASFTTARNMTLAGTGTLFTDAGTSLTDSTGLIAGTGTLVKSGAGTLTLCGTIANAGGISVTNGSLVMCGNDTATGATTIAAGARLALTGSGSIANTSGVNDNGAFDISGSTAGVSIPTLSGGGAVTLGGQHLTLTDASGTFAGAIGGTGGLAISGGTETLSGMNTYAGGTTVSNNGRLIVATDAALGNASGGVALNNGTLETTTSFTTARNVSLTGSATFATDPGVTLTQTGQFSGDGHITKVGDGTLVLAGNNAGWGQRGNSASGGITIDDGLVEVTNPYGLGYGLVTLNRGVIAATVDIVTGQTIMIAGDTVLNTDAGTTTTLTGTVETGGTGSCFLKTGPGTLAISGTATLSNGTCVQQGRLSANGILVSKVSVDAGALLRGTGTIKGPVSVSGTLAPGNSPGTLTTTGTVTMQAGSTYLEDINGRGTGTGPGNYSRLLVTGASSQFIASGATLEPDLVNITGTNTYTPYAPALGESFRIVTADGGIVGKFAAFDQPEGLASGTRLAIFYDVRGSNSIDLRVVPSSYSSYLQTAGANDNARSMGGALNQILDVDQNGHATMAQDELAYAISGLNAAQLPGAATALAGEIHADMAAVSPQADQWLQRSVARQLESGDASGEIQPGQGFWIDSTANQGQWRSDAQASGFTANRTQIALGIDLLTGQPNRVGLGYSHSLTDVYVASGSGSIEEDIGFLYGQFSLSHLLIDGMVGVGEARWDTSRTDPLGLTRQTLNTSSHGDSSLASLGVRWPWHAAGMVFAPYARVLWQREARDGFNEGNVLDALSSSGNSFTGVRTMAGLSGGSATQVVLGLPLAYQFDLGAVHDTAALAEPAVRQSLAGAEFGVTSPEIGQTFMQASFTGTVRVGKSTYMYLGLSAEGRGGKTEDQGVNAGLRMIF